MATDIMATSTTELTNPMRLASLRFARRSNNTLLAVVPRSIFDLKNLRELQLNNCGIKSLGGRGGGGIFGGGLGKLETLNLSGNMIERVGNTFCDDVAYKGCLVDLDLSNNSIGVGGGEEGNLLGLGRVQHEMRRCDLRGNPQRAVRREVLEGVGSEVIRYLKMMTRSEAVGGGGGGGGGGALFPPPHSEREREREQH